MNKPKNKEAVKLGKLRWANTTLQQRKKVSMALHKAKKAKKKLSPESNKNGLRADGI